MVSSLLVDSQERVTGNGYVSAQSANGIGIGPDEGEFDADRMEFEGEGGEVAAAF